LFLESANWRTVRIGNSGENVHQLYFYVDCVGRFRFLREYGEADK
jgi:hypothetical protein